MTHLYEKGNKSISNFEIQLLIEIRFYLMKLTINKLYDLLYKHLGSVQKLFS